MGAYLRQLCFTSNLSSHISTRDASNYARHVPGLEFQVRAVYRCTLSIESNYNPAFMLLFASNVKDRVMLSFKHSAKLLEEVGSTLGAQANIPLCKQNHENR